MAPADSQFRSILVEMTWVYWKHGNMCESDDPLRCSRLTLFSTPTSQKLHGTCESYKTFFFAPVLRCLISR